MTSASSNAPVLVCFAVSQEAKPFLKQSHGRENIRCLITGMGAKNAEAAVRRALKEFSPMWVFTCGYAGALHPELQIGDVVCSQVMPLPGVRSVKFACVERVAITATEKATLRVQTGADAVEMESAIIERVCREFKVPCQTLRAISDTAQEDLPLDFNALMTSDLKLSPWKLIWAVARSPGKIPALMQLGKNSALASERLADALMRVLGLPKR